MKRFLFATLALLTMVGIWSCGNDDEKEIIGNWPPIKVTVNGTECGSIPFLDVPAEGGVFRIFSENYGSLWLTVIRENEIVVVWPAKEEDMADYKNIHLTKDWYEVKYDETGNIVVTIQPLTNGSSRSLYIGLEAGDAFGGVTLTQKGS